MGALAQAQKRSDRVEGNIRKYMETHYPSVNIADISELYPMFLSFEVLSDDRTFSGWLTWSGRVKKNSVTEDY